MKLIPKIDLSLHQVRDVLVETIKEEDVVLQRTLVMKEKETVMDLEMEVNMMDTEDVREILCVEATIVNNLDIITMKRMIAVKNQDNINQVIIQKRLRYINIVQKKHM